MTPGAGCRSFDRGEQPGLAQRPRERARGRARRRALQGVDEAGRVVDRVDLAVPAHGEAGDEDRGVGQLLVPGDLLAVVAQAPDLAVLVVAVDIRPAQLGELRTVVDVAAGDRPALGVVVLDDGRNDRAGARPSCGGGTGGSLPARSSRSCPPCWTTRIISQRSWPTSPTQSRPVSGSKLIRQGLRNPNAQISGRAPGH